MFTARPHGATTARSQLVLRSMMLSSHLAHRLRPLAAAGLAIGVLLVGCDNPVAPNSPPTQPLVDVTSSCGGGSCGPVYAETVIEADGGAAKNVYLSAAVQQPTLVEIRMQGYITGIHAVNGEVLNVGPEGQKGSGGMFDQECYAKLSITFSGTGGASSGARCNMHALSYVDTVVVQGEGLVSRTSGHPDQFTNECVNRPCWEYGGAQTVTVREVPVTLALTAAHALEPAGTPVRPHDDLKLTVTASHPRAQFSVSDWRWTPENDTARVLCNPGAECLTSAIGRSGRVEATGRVNGRDTVLALDIAVVPSTLSLTVRKYDPTVPDIRANDDLIFTAVVSHGRSVFQAKEWWLQAASASVGDTARRTVCGAGPSKECWTSTTRSTTMHLRALVDGRELSAELPVALAPSSLWISSNKEDVDLYTPVTFKAELGSGASTLTNIAWSWKNDGDSVANPNPCWYNGGRECYATELVKSGTMSLRGKLDGRDTTVSKRLAVVPKPTTIRVAQDRTRIKPRERATFTIKNSRERMSVTNIKWWYIADQDGARSEPCYYQGQSQCWSDAIERSGTMWVKATVEGRDTSVATHLDVVPVTLKITAAPAPIMPRDSVTFTAEPSWPDVSFQIKRWWYVGATDSVTLDLCSSTTSVPTCGTRAVYQTGTVYAQAMLVGKDTTLHAPLAVTPQPLKLRASAGGNNSSSSGGTVRAPRLAASAAGASTFRASAATSTTVTTVPYDVVTYQAYLEHGGSQLTVRKWWFRSNASTREACPEASALALPECTDSSASSVDTMYVEALVNGRLDSAAAAVMVVPTTLSLRADKMVIEPFERVVFSTQLSSRRSRLEVKAWWYETSDGRRIDRPCAEPSGGVCTSTAIDRPGRMFVTAAVDGNDTTVSANLQVVKCPTGDPWLDDQAVRDSIDALYQRSLPGAPGAGNYGIERTAILTRDASNSSLEWEEFPSRNPNPCFVDPDPRTIPTSKLGGVIFHTHILSAGDSVPPTCGAQFGPVIDPALPEISAYDWAYWSNVPALSGVITANAVWTYTRTRDTTQWRDDSPSVRTHDRRLWKTPACRF
jgi:hypothetical protein